MESNCEQAPQQRSNSKVATALATDAKLNANLRELVHKSDAYRKRRHDIQMLLRKNAAWGLRRA